LVLWLPELNDKSSEMEALMQLGELKKRSQAYDEAASLFSEAMKLAEQQGELGRLKRLSCIIGVVLGEQHLTSFFDGLKMDAERWGGPQAQNEE
jgi:hypothetical protein